ncbi:MAG: IPT/TIG domain-containing protein [Solirubrobacteraceae bacterium]
MIEAEPPAHEPGAVSVCVRTPEGAADKKDAYTFGPTVTRVTPDEGALSGGETVTVEGRGFKGVAQGGEVIFVGTCANAKHQWLATTTVTATNLKEESPEKLTVKAPPQPSSEFGTTCISENRPPVVDVVVKTQYGWSARSGADHYYYGPSVERVTPDEGAVGGGATVTINGHGFKPPGLTSAEVSFKVGAEVLSATGVEVKSAEEVKAIAPAAPNGAPAAADVQVTTNQGATKSTSPQLEADRYFYGPNVTGLEAHAGPTAGGNLVTIEGHGFQAGSGVKFGEAKASSVEVISPEEIKASAPPHATGAVHVTVGTPGGESAPEEAGLYAFGLPFVEKVEPGEGSAGGGSEVKITGQNLEGATAVKFVGAGERAATHFEVRSATEIVAVTPPLPEGLTVAVVVQTTAGTSPSWPAAHYGSNAPPVIYKVAPERGPAGSKIRISGENLAGVTGVSIGGIPASFTITNPFGRESPHLEQRGTEIIAVAPRHVPGTVDVTVTGLRGTSAIHPASDSFTYLGFGVEELEAGACLSPFCSYLGSATEFFTQAAGHPEEFVVNLAVNSAEPLGGLPGYKEPAGILKSARLDLPPGLVFNPHAVEQCPSLERASRGSCPLSLVGKVEITVQNNDEPATQGLNRRATVAAEVWNLVPPEGVPAELGFQAPVEVQHQGHELGLPEVYLQGHVSWHREPVAEKGWGAADRLVTGDYHAYSVVTNAAGAEEAQDLYTPLAWQRLIFNGNALSNGFITLPSACSESVAYHLKAESYGQKELGEANKELLPVGQESETARVLTTTQAASGPVGVTGCGKVPFQPEITVTPETAQPDRPDGVTVEVKMPQGLQPIDSADPKQISITLPEGMSVNPSSANGLQACSDEQFGIEEEGGRAITKHGGVETGAEGHEVEGPSPGVQCPASSQVGTLEVQSPDLAEPLRGDIYIGEPMPGATPESGEEYRIFLHAEAHKSGVDVRLLGHVSANPVTGRLTTTVENPQLPFSRAITRLTGPRISLANPIACVAGAKTESLFKPYGGPEGPAVASPFSAFALEGGCPFQAPFELSQSAAEATSQAAANTTFTLEWGREDGQQYLSATKTTLPPGLTGSIKSVPKLCGEAEANAGTCPAESRIGRVLSASGAGMPGEPDNVLTLGGQVYLTGPYDGAPYGLAIVVPAEHVGPYDFGKIVTRAKIEINPETTQVTTTSIVPTIVGGAPVRLRRIQIVLDRPGFMYNPTHCSAGAIESTLSGADALPAGAPTATQELKTPFTATGCGSLPFKPDFTASTQANTSRTNGASLTVAYTQKPGEANVHEIDTQLPMVLPSRLKTLQKACTEAQFALNPAGCPAASSVGTAIAKTPLLSAPLTGKAVLVSHGGAAFPDVDFLLEGDGVKVRVVGHTQIKHGITYSRFETVPDTPVSSFEVNFPEGPDSLFAANGSFCSRIVTTKKRVPKRRHGHVVRRHGRVVRRTVKVRHRVPVTLVMPTTIVGQNGARVSQSTKIEVSGCRPAARPRYRRPRHRR